MTPSSRNDERPTPDAFADPGPGFRPTPPDAATWQRWSIDPTWSRTLEVASHEGGSHRWHLLDTGPPEVAAAHADDDGYPTILCVHGNPTWGYAWASFLRTLRPRTRVIAIDQLGMGYSERTMPRRYSDRVRDLDDIIVGLGLPGAGPLVIAAHDWGGAIAMGWVVQDPHQVAGLILCNTGIAVPEGRAAPAIIRVAASAPLLDLLCRGTPLFVEGTTRLSGRRLSKIDREAFRAPYRSAPARAAIADFVADIPLREGHPSERSIADVADRLHTVTAPVLLAWGGKDPVFNDDFADDLAARFPNTTLHRYAEANHLVMAEADVAGAAELWLDDLLAGRLVTGLAPPSPGSAPASGVVPPNPDSVSTSGAPPSRPDTASTATVGPADADTPVDAAPVADVPNLPIPLWARVIERSDDDGEAFVDVADSSSLTWRELAGRVEAIAADLVRRGLCPGDRVAMLTPPGIDLVAAVYGVWRAGGVTVIADRGLGLRGLGRAVRSTRPSWVIGPRTALVAAASMRWAPRATKVEIGDLMAAEGGVPPSEPVGADLAAILFTSGATGPAKGVRYRHRQLTAQRDALAATYDIVPSDRLVAAFAPFALYGPALGIPTALPDCDVTKPASLTADALEAACARIGATLTFASPSALATVAATAGSSSAGLEAIAELRLVLSAGAPVPAETLRAVASLAPDASFRTPYGMTEVLPVADIDLDEIERSQIAQPAGGVCVGHPVDGVEVRVVPLAVDDGTLPDAVEDASTGEILIRAAWVSDGYHGLWATQRGARPPAGDPTGGVWHRSGDVGHIDAEGRLWVEGRAADVIGTADGPVTSVPVERLVERALDVRPVAAVGVGPSGSQQVVVVVQSGDGDGPAPDGVVAAVRAATDVPIAAVLAARHLPVDIRHNAKIDRAEVAAWASKVLAGERAGRLR